jgi:hypothetical protein
MIHTFENKEPTLEEAQELVGGYVTLLPLPPHMQNGEMQVLVNEEGLLKGLPLNEKASQMFQQKIVGSVVILKGKARWT